MPENIRFTIYNKKDQELMDVEAEYDAEIFRVSEGILQLLKKDRGFEYSRCEKIVLRHERTILQESKTLAQEGLRNGAKVYVEPRGL